MTNRALFLLASILTGCAAIIGVPDLTYDPDGQGGPDGGGGGPDGTTGEGGTDPGRSDGGGPCDESRLSDDPNNCGRCGHGCGGGGCNAGKCEPITLVDAVGGPQQIAVDGTYVYFAAHTDGVIRRIKKDATGTAETLVSGVPNAVGVALDGTRLYFSWVDGVEKCTLDADAATCGATRAFIFEKYYSQNLAVANGDVYAVINTEVFRIPGDDAGAYEIGSGPSAWGIATNGTYVYWTSYSQGLSRALVDGGSKESAGPLSTETQSSYVTSEGDSVFWSYKEDGADAGLVYGTKHASPIDRIEYTKAGGHPVGIAADAQYVYWSDRGSVNGPTPAGDGVLYACPRAGGCGGAPLVLATGLQGGGAMATDDAFVYFVEKTNTTFGGSGRIRKVAKP